MTASSQIIIDTIKMKRILLIVCMLLVALATKAQDGNIMLGIRAGHNTVQGGFAAVSLEAEHAFERHFSINGGVQYNTVGKTAAEVRPAYFHDLKWGRLSAEAMLHYTNMHDVNNLAAGAGLALDTKWIFCRLGYYYRALGQSADWIKEPFNIYYTFGVSCLPNIPEWDLQLYATNCERFELDRHHQPSLVVQGWFYPGDRLGITLGVNYKPAGMLHLSTDYYQVYTKAGICYRW